MNNPDHISELGVWVKILKFFDVDPGWKKYVPRSAMEKKRIRDNYPGSATLAIS
jgi:hypothetical protein